MRPRRGAIEGANSWNLLSVARILPCSANSVDFVPNLALLGVNLGSGSGGWSPMQSVEYAGSPTSNHWQWVEDDRPWNADVLLKFMQEWTWTVHTLRQGKPNAAQNSLRCYHEKTTRMSRSFHICASSHAFLFPVGYSFK